MNLLRALENDCLYPAHQKIIDTKTNRVVAHEILARCKVNGQSYYPAAFIPKAKHHGVMHEITLYVLEKAIKHNQFAPIVLNANFSPDELALPLITKLLNALIAKYQYPKHLITLEISETPCHATWQSFRNNVKAMRIDGWSFSLDDYGIDNQNLQRLIELPVNQIKLDRTLLPFALRYVTDIHNDSINGLYIEEREKRLSIIKSIAEFSTRAGIEVVAEGVETKAVSDILTEIGVTLQQGYYHHKPEPYTVPKTVYRNHTEACKG